MRIHRPRFTPETMNMS